MKPIANHPVDIIAEELNTNGWWKQDTRDTYIECYDKLVTQGIKECDIIEILGDLFFATADEFGG